MDINTIKNKFKTKLTSLIKKKSFIIWNSILLISILLNILSWYSTSFSDWFVNNIFIFNMNIFSRITGIFPFSVGEIMIILGILLLLTALIFLILLPFLKKRLKKFYSIFYRFFAWVIVCIIFVMTCNCFILYHTSTIEETYMEETTNKKYEFDKLLILYEYVANNLNELSSQMKRDEHGYIIYNKDIIEEAKVSMKQLGNDYARLSGYYPDAKKILFSDFMSQTYTSGVYFPFSMEANYNTSMYIANMPAVVCHEYAHLKGYIYEDEANFIGYLACINSDDAFFKYSGYLSVLYYIENAIYENIDQINDDELLNKLNNICIKDIVYADDIFLTQDTWDEIEDNSIFDTETIDQVSDTFSDVSLKLNGVEDGQLSYSRVVNLLLKYYDNTLY